LWTGLNLPALKTCGGNFEVHNLPNALTFNVDSLQTVMGVVSLSTQYRSTVVSMANLTSAGSLRFYSGKGCCCVVAWSKGRGWSGEGRCRRC